MAMLNYLFSHIKLRIRRRELVIEIGGGGDPFLRSDILVDRYIDDDTERHTGLVLDRPTMAADGVLLPFPDKSIDFLICSHVLEHITDPKRFLNEISRVAKRGLIITPDGGYERLHPKRGHLWYVWNENGSLRLKQKKCWNEFPEVQEYFRKITRLSGYWRFWDKHYSSFNTILAWENGITYRIEQDGEFDLSKFIKASNDPGRYPIGASTIPARQRAKSWLGKVVRRLISTHCDVDLNDVICCPMCRGSLSRIMPDSIFTKCGSCGAKFQVRGSIAHLNKEEASFSAKTTISTNL